MLGETTLSSELSHVEYRESVPLFVLGVTGGKGAAFVARVLAVVVFTLVLDRPITFFAGATICLGEISFVLAAIEALGPGEGTL